MRAILFFYCLEMGAVNVADIIVRSNLPCVACFAPGGAMELSASGSESNAGDFGMELSDSDTGSSSEVGAGNATGVHEDMVLSDSVGGIPCRDDGRCDE